MSPLLAYLITLIVGPVAFVVWAHVIYKTDSLRKFPVGILDGIGDTILLPGFNALAVYYGVLQQPFSMYHLLISLVLGLLVLLIFIFEVRKEMQDSDWSLPRNGEFNAGGWYHAVFMFFDSTFIFYTLQLFPQKILLWTVLLSFILLFGVHIYLQRNRSG
jgi:hypothetical protein